MEVVKIKIGRNEYEIKDAVVRARISGSGKNDFEQQVSTKLFLAGALTQDANPQTYSNDKCYIGTDNCLYTNGSKTVIASDVTDAIYTELYGSTTKLTGAYVVTNQNFATAAQEAGFTGNTGTGDGDTKNTAGVTNSTR